MRTTFVTIYNEEQTAKSMCLRETEEIVHNLCFMLRPQFPAVSLYHSLKFYG